MTSDTGGTSDMPREAVSQSAYRQLVDQNVFASAVHTTRMPMTLVDPHLPDSPIVYANPAFVQLTGYAAQEILGRNCRFLQGPETDPKAVSRLRDAIRAREPIAEDLYNYRRDGSGFWNSLYIAPVFHEDGRLIYFFASQFDISARKEAARRQVMRIESMGALASGVAHEFNNLMTMVLGSVERIGSHGLDAHQTEHLQRAEWAAHRAGQLANDLLALARRRAKVERTIDLNQLVTDFRAVLAEIVPSGVDFRLQLESEGVVRLVPDQLELVLLNLVRNAAEAASPGGTITVRTRRLTPTEASAALNGAGIELSVLDDGPGMPPEILDRAKELFFTTKADSKGTGLGLYLALEFADRSGGRLTLESSADTGTTVRLLLPLSA